MGFFLDGLANGFRIGFSSPLSTLRPSRRNLPSALEHPKVVDEYLQKEITENRVAGPFLPEACVGHISRFGVIPKSHQHNKWRLIFDLSSPRGHSVNDGVPKELCSMSYVSVDDAVRKILDSGPGSMLAKIDIKSAFRRIPVQLRCLWFFVAYFDTCLTIEHLAGALNITADQLSRNNMQSFFVTTPQADQQQTPFPAELLQIMALHGPDWTSQEFKELFAAIIRRV